MDTKPALLLVEDEVEISMMVKEFLEREIPTIYTAGNGLEALEKLQAHKNIRAIISDISMPKMSGLELLKRLRAQYNPIPFVMLTAYGNTETMRSAIQWDATDFLNKPFKNDELLRVASNAFQYGVELHEAELKIEELSKGFPDENAEKFKRLRRTVMAMRIESSIYKPGSK